MSDRPFSEYVARIANDADERSALQAALTSPDALVDYALSSGHPISLAAAEAFIAEANRQTANGAEPLSEEALDAVNGAGWRQHHFS
ncbi:hypothetical protein GCM10007301_31980 [Azorhizobium oxalatiphilum]|uniref:Nif11 domain-containing protein n=1 Tax=Azorhizobium oxalatiphilum TaxID=980631 RepID=A0A917FCB9_9HYPH|nr:hypothetical protein [Azorhizobium oxalatiphilum]GGF69859.1 hypothetical protein GCM10007301_31980 [Azorhizobium oxalatiphilum]